MGWKNDEVGGKRYRVCERVFRWSVQNNKIGTSEKDEFREWKDCEIREGRVN